MCILLTNLFYMQTSTRISPVVKKKIQSHVNVFMKNDVVYEMYTNWFTRDV